MHADDVTDGGDDGEVLGTLSKNDDNGVVLVVLGDIIGLVHHLECADVLIVVFVGVGGVSHHPVNVERAVRGDRAFADFLIVVLKC